MIQELGKKSYSELRKEHPGIVVICQQGIGSLEVRESLTPRGEYGPTLSLNILRPSRRDKSDVVGYISASFFDRSKQNPLGNDPGPETEYTYLKYMQTDASFVQVEVRNTQDGIEVQDATMKAAIGLRMLQAFHEAPAERVRYERNAPNMWRDLNPDEVRMLLAFQTDALVVKSEA